MTIEKPNTDTASRGNLGGKMRDVLQRWLRDEVDGMLPAQVISYDDLTNRAVLRPLVMVGTTSGGKVARAKVSGIPVYRFGGGGFFMRFPIKPGDRGWIASNDRDISLVLQAGGGEDWPNTERLHSFSDAMFYPDTFKDWIIDGANTDAAVWQSLDGTQCIALRPAEIDLKSGASSINISAAGVAVTGPMLTHNGVNIGATHTHPINSGSSAPGPTGTPTA